MITTEYILELSNVYHSGQVETGTCLQKIIGNVRTGVILKDVSMEVHGGELSAVLGSKGSGKRALFEVISRRAQGPTRGQILLNGVPMSMRLFQESCGYVAQKCDLLPGLTVRQTLHYAAALTIGSKVSSYVKTARVKQVLADLALSPVAGHQVETLSQSEYRRLAIGVQLVRDPVVLLLDEPTWDLDPLNTYFVISILANHAKKYNRIVLLTMEKPRSDIFPFLDRVTYLCLGDVVYTGATRMMLDYFRAIGFPCPELENPLMYYLCLSTVDRRSRERFIESNNQIASLVEKFKVEGASYRKFSGLNSASTAPDMIDNGLEGGGAHHQKVPLTAYGRPGSLTVLMNLIRRTWSQAIPFSKTGGVGGFESWKNFSLRLLLLPMYFFILWIFFYHGFQEGTTRENQYQRTYVTRNGLVFSSLAGAYFMAIITTACTFASERTRYYQESREGMYSGPLFVVANLISSIPFSMLSSFISTFIIFRGLKDHLICQNSNSLTGNNAAQVACQVYSQDVWDAIAEGSGGERPWIEYGYYPDFIAYWLALWACYLFAEQQTVSLLMVVKSSYTAALASVYLTIVYIVLGSATVRSYDGMPDALNHLTYVTQSRYTGAALNSLEFYNRSSLLNLSTRNETMDKSFACYNERQNQNDPINSFAPFGCRYLDGTHYLEEKYNLKGDDLREVMDIWFNLGIAYVFPGILLLINLVLYLIPLPAFIKAKFRE